MLKKCHFIGIGGIGMSGLARLILHQKGVVSGSDLSQTTITDELVKNGAEIFLGHCANNVKPGMTVIYSTDIKNDNPEFLAAKNLKCPLLHRSELLQKLMENHLSLAVAGTHGKTTTSSLLTWVLEYCGESPTYAIGGIIPQLSSNSGLGSGKYFVAEACESDGTFLNYKPYGIILTNIDFDHMDFYGSGKAMIEAFNSFIEKALSPNHLFWCGDDVYLKKIHPRGYSYGFGENCQLRADNFKQNGWKISIDIYFQNKTYKNVEIALAGKHNALNALAVFGLAITLGMEEKKIRNALSSFKGVNRRCEIKGEQQGVLFIDDYAHHPTELKATLKAIRSAVGERRLVAIYQPHRYTRAQDCLGLYNHVFSDVDELFITEIYSAGEPAIEGISHEKIIAEIVPEFKNRCHYVERKRLSDKLLKILRPHDVLITLGAGDITKVNGEIMKKMTSTPLLKLKLGLLFGGMSVEHDISLISSKNIEEAINKEYYELENFAISRQGFWNHGFNARKSLETISPEQNLKKIDGETLDKFLACDVLFPVLHGTYGEDGTIQGFFNLFAKAYVGCDQLASAICMDKVLSKRLALEAGLPTLPFQTFTRFEWKEKKLELTEIINRNLIYPLFVKPVHLGSSIGVHKVENEKKLLKAIEESFEFDECLIVENGIENVREIEFSLLGNHEVTVFPPGEVYANGQMHDYDSKYGLNPKKCAASFETAPKLSTEQVIEGMALAKSVYQAIGCAGMARVDTFLDPQGKFWFNEINPIPGFTKYSLYPLMCEANGLPLTKLIDRLIILGMQRRRQLDRIKVKNDQ